MRSTSSTTKRQAALTQTETRAAKSGWPTARDSPALIATCMASTAPATRARPAARRFEAIIREMTNTVMKASRSAVIKNARDMSCGLLTYDHRLVSVEEGIPIHITALDLTTKPITQFFDDIEEGDAFLNNCPYTG